MRKRSAKDREAVEALNILKWQKEKCRLYFYADSLHVPESELDTWIHQYSGLGPKPYAHAVQRDLHLATADIKVFRAGNRGGKSVFLVNEIAMECEGIHPNQLKGLRPKPPVYWWIIAPIIPSDADIPSGEDAPILRKFFDWVPVYDPAEVGDDRYAHFYYEFDRGRPVRLPPARMRGIKRFYRKDKILVWHNGSVVKFKGHDQDLTRMASDDVDGVGHDEESPYRFWHELRARTIDRGGLQIFAMTPHYAAWTWAEFKRPEYEELRIKEVEMDMMLNPFIGETEKKKFLAGLSGQELLMRRLGKYVHAEGLAFQNFNKDRHVLQPDQWLDINDRDFTIFVVIDWHAAKSIIVTYLAIDPRGYWYVFDESVVDQHDPISLGQEIESRLNRRRVRKYIIDRNASIKQVQEGKQQPRTIIDMLRNTFGIRCIVGSVEPFESGHAMLEEKLKHDELCFFSSCKRHIQEISTWGVDRRKTGELRGTFRDKFTDEGNDTCINLIYAVNERCRYTFRRAADWPQTSYGRSLNE